MSSSSWHLRKEVTLGNIVATVAAIAMMIAAFYNLDSRVLQNTSQIATNVIHIEDEKVERKELKRDIYKKLDNIERLLIKHYEVHSKS